jgi:hypothetical protein
MAECPASSAAAAAAFPSLQEDAPAAKKRRLAGTAAASAATTPSSAVEGPPPQAAAAAAAAARAAATEVFSAVLLGTGASNRVPRIDHVLSQDCAVCTHATLPSSRNRRNNVSLALLCRGKTIMIDAGKTMYTAVTQTFPAHGLKTVHAILLTHGHADAILVREKAILCLKIFLLTADTFVPSLSWQTDNVLNRKAEKENVWFSQGLDDVRELQKMERVTVSSNPAYDIQITRRLSRACLGKFTDKCCHVAGAGRGRERRWVSIGRRSGTKRLF